VIVVDASAILEILKHSDVGLDLALKLDDEDIHAPHLIDVEVASALRRWVARGEMTATGALRAFDEFIDIPLQRHPHTHLLPEIWKHRHNLSAYDACYLALSMYLDAELLSIDGGLVKSATRRIH
jgi:predicted nucleic acid-binding protein